MLCWECVWPRSWHFFWYNLQIGKQLLINKIVKRSNSEEKNGKNSQHLKKQLQFTFCQQINFQTLK